MCQPQRFKSSVRNFGGVSDKATPNHICDQKFTSGMRVPWLARKPAACSYASMAVRYCASGSLVKKGGNLCSGESRGDDALLVEEVTPDDRVAAQA